MNDYIFYLYRDTRNISNNLSLLLSLVFENFFNFLFMIIHIFLDYDDLFNHMQVLLWIFPIPHIHINFLISTFVFIWLLWFPNYMIFFNILYYFFSHTCSYLSIQKKLILLNNFEQNLLSSSFKYTIISDMFLLHILS